MELQQGAIELVQPAAGADHPGARIDVDALRSIERRQQREPAAPADLQQSQGCPVDRRCDVANGPSAAAHAYPVADLDWRLDGGGLHSCAHRKADASRGPRRSPPSVPVP